MIVVSFETKKDQQEILARAAKYFVDQAGLKEIERDDCCIRFEDESQIGYVKVTLLQQKNQAFKVEVESKEYEYHAKRFLLSFK